MSVRNQIILSSSLFISLSIPSLASVTINSPSNESEVKSPIAISAFADRCSTQDVAAMSFSLDSSPDATISSGAFLETSMVSPPGVHTLHITSMGEKGSVCVSEVTFTVKPDAVATSIIPANATNVHSVQALKNWAGQHDTGGSGQASGSTSIVGSPTINGGTRQFVTHYKGSGDERFAVSYADDEKALHFFYDAWLYIPSSSGPISNIELDTNQVNPARQTIIMGVQCDGWSGTWTYMANVGSPSRPKPHWANAKGTKCVTESWAKNKWHHVQAYYTHDTTGHVTYHSIWMDGVENKVNATVLGAFDLGWGPDINTQFQIDGRGASGSAVVYVDNMTISRW
jgi:hypothetical protein